MYTLYGGLLPPRSLIWFSLIPGISQNCQCLVSPGPTWHQPTGTHRSPSQMYVQRSTSPPTIFLKECVVILAASLSPTPNEEILPLRVYCYNLGRTAIFFSSSPAISLLGGLWSFACRQMECPFCPAFFSKRYPLVGCACVIEHLCVCGQLEVPVVCKKELPDFLLKWMSQMILSGLTAESLRLESKEIVAVYKCL